MRGKRAVLVAGAALLLVWLSKRAKAATVGDVHGTVDFTEFTLGGTTYAPDANGYYRPVPNTGAN